MFFVTNRYEELPMIVDKLVTVSATQLEKPISFWLWFWLSMFILFIALSLTTLDVAFCWGDDG